MVIVLWLLYSTNNRSNYMENKRELRENITEFVGKLNTLQKQYYNLRQENQNYKNQLQSS